MGLLKVMEMYIMSVRQKVCHPEGEKEVLGEIEGAFRLFALWCKIEGIIFS